MKKLFSFKLTKIRSDEFEYLNVQRNLGMLVGQTVKIKKKNRNLQHWQTQRSETINIVLFSSYKDMLKTKVSSKKKSHIAYNNCKLSRFFFYCLHLILNVFILWWKYQKFNTKENNTYIIQCCTYNDKGRCRRKCCLLTEESHRAKERGR